MSNTPAPQPNRLRVWQQNINKSQVAQEDLINSDVSKHIDLLLLQEPYIDSYSNTKATRDWRVIYPSNHLSSDKPACSVVLVSTSLDTNRWSQISILNTNDLTAIQFHSASNTLDLYNIYNDCQHNTTLDTLDSHLTAHSG